MTNPSFSRRNILKAASIAVAAGAVGSVAGQAAAGAQGRVLGTVIDYSGGVPSGASVKAAGHMGAVRYVSQRRPGANWMIGKPVTLAETRDFANHGLATASVYQFGKAETADWKRGAAGAATHAPQAIALHRAAGGPTGRPIYVAIDDNPTWAQYDTQIRPYLQAFNTALTAAGYTMGIYGNYSTIDWAIRDGLGRYFWMHNWGSGGRIHPRTTIHQVRIDRDTVGGVVVDINNVYAQDWGQWLPDQPAATVPAAPSVPAPAAPAPGGSSLGDLPTIDINGSSLGPQHLQQVNDLANQINKFLP